MNKLIGKAAKKSDPSTCPLVRWEGFFASRTIAEHRRRQEEVFASRTIEQVLTECTAEMLRDELALVVKRIVADKPTYAPYISEALKTLADGGLQEGVK
tara:strand:+ start:1314 stop:1610 length:297 start_codon:yes stop_codon:yes gene_type:complete